MMPDTTNTTDTISAIKTTDTATVPCLIVRDLHVTRGNSTLLGKLSFELLPGQCLAIQSNHITGQLLIDVMLGLQEPSGGQALLHGQPLRNNGELMPSVSCIRQQSAVYDRLHAREALTFFMQLYGKKDKARVQSLLQIVGLKEKQHTALGRLTPSEQRRFHLARAAAQRPDLILIEDPEFQLDMEGSYLLRQWIQAMTEEGTAVLLTVPALEDALTLTSNVIRWTRTGFKSVIIEDEDKRNVIDNKPAIYAEDDSTDTMIVEDTEVADAASILENIVHPEDAATNDSEPETAAATIFTPFKLDKIPARIQDKIILIDPVDINYVESQDGMSHLHVQSEGISKLHDAAAIGREIESVRVFPLSSFLYRKCSTHP
ncbi:ATP-binding cassette domain-containing protein [Paenibacillus sp. SC116]|uniref:ABC transporter ATP-binding protein n=1 Tax=Paenibacillus sp. SC116 TaxID=2968986 RepID=UPI00215ABDAF|nr:ATP-binding cassette domain-containing protein [Paenibacillus sp. SC116]MCR8844648.1 ATP-binding cassette domain-containing protein [Paenibacillus sp. SC116]